MRYCISCGLGLDEKWSFCPNCGSEKIPEDMTKTISINQNNSDSTNSKKNSDSINAIFLIFSLIAVAMIIFSIDKFFDYEDYSKAAENCQEGSDELASIGIDSPALCTDIESEATKNMIESFISGSIGIGIMFIVITQQGPKAVSELDKKHSNPRNNSVKTKPRDKKSKFEIQKTLEINTRSNPVRCRYFYKTGPNKRCSNTHLNKMYCDEHIELLKNKYRLD